MRITSTQPSEQSSEVTTEILHHYLRELFQPVVQQVQRLCVVVRHVPPERGGSSRDKASFDQAVRITAHLRDGAAITVSQRDRHLTAAVALAADRLLIAVGKSASRSPTLEHPPTP